MNITHIVEKFMELEKLNNQYGWQSCFDVPQAYEDMEKLSTEIYKELKEIAVGGYSNDYGTTEYFSEETLYTYIKNVAFEILNNKEEELEEVNLYCQTDYINLYIVGGYSEEQNEMFDELFYYMDSTHRNAWLLGRDNFVNNSDFYGNGDFFIVVN